jgi:hypothetical protein
MAFLYEPSSLLLFLRCFFARFLPIGLCSCDSWDESGVRGLHIPSCLAPSIRVGLDAVALLAFRFLVSLVFFGLIDSNFGEFLTLS